MSGRWGVADRKGAADRGTSRANGEKMRTAYTRGRREADKGKKRTCAHTKNRCGYTGGILRIDAGTLGNDTTPGPGCLSDAGVGLGRVRAREGLVLRGRPVPKRGHMCLAGRR